MKKIFSAIISSPLKGRLGGVLFALLSTTTLWAYDFESGGFDYTITSNSKHTVAVSGYYKTYSGHMQIPSSVVHNGITYSVTSIKDDAFNSEKCQNLTSVTIPNSIITIGWSAFLGCESLVSVDIGDNVEVIDMFAFAACRSLTSICIPDNVKTIKDRAFTECASLKSLTIGKSVTQIGNLSFSQNSLETITCKAIQVPSITSTTFSYVPCSSATLYVLPSLLDQYKTTNGWNKFGNILPIDGIVEDTYSVTVTCNPEEGTVSGGGVYQAGATATLTATPKDGYEFVRWSDGNTANPRTLTVTKDLSLNAEFAIIEDDDVIDSGTCGENLTWTLTYNGVLTISGTGDMYNYNYAYSTYAEIIKNVIVMDGVTSIGKYAFSDCSSLTSITIPNSITSIESKAFYGCYSLTSITIPNSVTSIGNFAFYGTGIYNNESNWENDVLYISNCLIEAKTKISGSYTIKDNTRLLAQLAFNGCTSLTSVTIPNSITSIGESAFDGCSSLTSVTIPNSVTSIEDDAFSYCTSLASITIPNSVTSIGERAFYDCSSLTSITIPNSVTSIGKYAFSDCTSLTSITIPNSVTSIEHAAFSGCTSLTYITIPNSVTSIGDAAFSDCTSLTSITIPNSVTFIGQSAFSGCTSLTTIICKAIKVPTLGYYVFDNIPQTEATLYVPAESLEDYKAANQWKYFGNILPIDNITYSITLTCNPEHGTVSGDGVYQVGETATLTATPKDGYEFVRWSDGSTANPRTLTVTADLTLTAEFAKINIPTYTVTLTCNPEHGTVSGGGVYQAGETATLIATPKDGYEFVRWSDGNTANPRTLTITEDVTLTAEFNLNENAIMLRIICGENLIGTLTYNGVLTISGTGDMYNYNFAYSTYAEIIKNVIVMDGVTSIGAGAFRGCSSLTSITIPNSVTSIGDYAFNECSSLTSIIIPNSVTSIGDYAFTGCSSLASLSIGNSVTSIGYGAFRGCSSLTSITIPNSVTSIGDDAFSWCSSLTKTNYTGNIAGWCNIKFGDGEANPMCNSHNFYINDQEIKDLVIPNSVTSIGNYAFSGCSSLTSVTIPNSVTSIGDGAFSGCSSLTSVTIPNCVTSIGAWAFRGCSSLTSITIPNSVTSIGDGAFSGCSGLTSATISNSVTSIGDYTFDECSSLTSITIPNSVTSIGKYAFKYCSSLTSITIPNSVTSIGKYAFEYCSSLTSITIPNSVTSIGMYAFSRCSSLTSITIPNSVTSIGEGAFYNCSSLASVTLEATTPPTFGGGGIVFSSSPTCNIPCGTLAAYQSSSWAQQVGSFVEQCDEPVVDANKCGDNLYWAYTDGTLTITGTGAMYNYDFMDNLAPWNSVSNNIKNIVLPEGLTSIGEWAFYLCASVTSISIPEGVSSIGVRAFCNCSSLTSISIPNSVTSIGERAFYNCYNLASVTLSTNLSKIDKYLFGQCRTLIAITIPNNVTAIENGAFSGCSSLTSITIPNSVTCIGDYAFRNCSALLSVVIGSSVANLGSFAFGECRNLQDIYCYAQDVPNADSTTWIYSNNNNACLHVLCESLNAYQTDDVFSCFTHIQCIESEVVATEDVVITPSTNDVTITWPIESSAETYTILITKDDEICNSLNFDKDGRVVNIAFSPSRDRNNYPAQYAEQAGNGFRFTITGLEDGTDYAYTITIKNANDQIIKTHSGNFSTLPFSAVEDIYANGNSRSHKLLHNGQLIILRDGKTYTIMGAEIK